MEWAVQGYLTDQGVWDVSISDEAGGPVRSLISAMPVETFFASVAHCFAKSVHMVQDARSEAHCNVWVEVGGSKATEGPNRVGSMWMRARLEGLDPDRAARIAKDAKRICTVSNTLNCDFEMVE